jgi:hypothetical protein
VTAMAVSGIRNDGTHLCPVRWCKHRVPAGKLMCPGHWRKLPQPIRAAVLRAWDGGRGQGSLPHIAAILRAIDVASRQAGGDQ